LAPDEPLNVAVIGVLGMGHFHLKTLLDRDDVRLAYLCDVDEAALERAAKTVEAAKKKVPPFEGDCRLLLLSRWRGGPSPYRPRCIHHVPTSGGLRHPIRRQ
jgi:hypothetical protein